MVYSYVYPAAYNSGSYPGANGEIGFLVYMYGVSQTDTYGEFYEYMYNRNLYYQYAWIHPHLGETAASIPETRWTDFSTSSPNQNGYAHLLYQSPYFTLAQMRSDYNKMPDLALRVKGGSGCYYTYANLTIRGASFYPFDVTWGATSTKINFGMWSDYDGVLAYPYEYKITGTGANAGTTYFQSGPADSIQYGGTRTITPTHVQMPPGTYVMTATDRQGYTVTRQFEVNTYCSSNDLTWSYSYKDAAAPSCTRYDSAYCYAYRYNGYNVGPHSRLNRTNFTYIGASTSSSSTWLPTPGDPQDYTSVVPLPPVLSFTTPDNFDNGASYVYVYPLNVDPLDQSSASGRRKAYSTRNEWPYGIYLHWSVTDSCGNTRRMVVSHGYPFHEFTYDRQPADEIRISENCGVAEITMPQINNLIKYDYYNNGFGAPQTNLSWNAAYRVKTGTGNIPSGAQVTYSNINDYCVTPTDKIYLTSSGKYVIQTVRTYNNNTSSVSFSSAYCMREDTIEINLPPFQMDKNLTAAFRCPTPDGTIALTGLIQVKPLNGSGGYRYDLFLKADDPETATPIDTKYGGVNDGVFTSWAGITGDDSLKIKVTDTICLRSFVELIAIYDLNNATVAWQTGSARKCIGDPLYLHALPLGDDATFKWTYPNGTISNLQHPVIPSLTTALSGIYHLEVTIPGCSDAKVERDVAISVADKLMYWNPDAEDNNWHNSNNWLLKNGTPSASFPASCTTVHIAGNAMHYPSLDVEGSPRTVGSDYVGPPACDTIIYHYGGETSYPHYLRYNRAKVQYNFRYYTPLLAPPNGTIGSQPTVNYDVSNYPNSSSGDGAPPYMERNRWYIIAAPLKYLTGGDFGIAGYPSTYQRLYNATNPHNRFAYHDNFTTPFPTLNGDIQGTGHAMSLLVADNYNIIGWNNHSNLQTMRGIFEMPFYMENNPTVMTAHLQTYNPVTSTSTFQYFDYTDLSLRNNYETMTRNYKGYRFVYENAQDTVTLGIDAGGNTVAMYHMPLGEILSGSATQRVMIGNPLMCHINFDRIYDYNDDVIEDHYWAVDAAESFLDYTIGITPASGGTTEDIAPLQGFVVQVKPDGLRSRNYLTLPLEGNYSVVSQHGWNYNGGTTPKPPLPKPRAAKDASQTQKTGQINICGVTPMPAEIAESPTDSIRISTSFLFGYEKTGNTPKIVFPEGLANKAEVFAISQDGNEINSRQFENGKPQILRFGLESQYTGEIVLQFAVLGELLEKATLYDKVRNISIPVFNGSTYRFTHRFDRVEGEYRGMDSERFELTPVYRSGEGLDGSDYYLSVGVQEQELNVLSSEPLSEVEVVNAAGASLFRTAGIGASSYRRQLNVPEGVYIVKVRLADGRRTTHKVLIKE
jgi:hypothetical protein